jgi:hypothetical protein
VGEVTRLPLAERISFLRAELARVHAGQDSPLLAGSIPTDQTIKALLESAESSLASHQYDLEHARSHGNLPDEDDGQ